MSECLKVFGNACVNNVTISKNLVELALPTIVLVHGIHIYVCVWGLRVWWGGVYRCIGVCGWGVWVYSNVEECRSLGDVGVVW